MKLTYAIKIDDFKDSATVHTASGKQRGLQGRAGSVWPDRPIGCVYASRGYGHSVGGFLIGLGAVGATAAYFYEQRSVRTKREVYDKNISDAFREIHCRDQRVFAVDENGLTVSCACAIVTQPWSELTSLSENATHFALGTKAGGHVLPKSAFSSAQIIELRAFVSGKLNQDKSVAFARHIDFACTPGDYRAAYWLHTLKGGGWRHPAKRFATSAFATWGCVVIWRYVSDLSRSRRSRWIDRNAGRSTGISDDHA